MTVRRSRPISRICWFFGVFSEEPVRGGVRNSEPCCSRYRSAEWQCFACFIRFPRSGWKMFFELCAKCIVFLGIIEAGLNISV